MTPGRIAASVAIAAWLGAQMGVPAWLLLHERAERSTDFSWDMFSHRLHCSRLSFAARAGGGPWRPLEPSLFFASPPQMRRVIYHDRLPLFLDHACATLRARFGQRLELRGIAMCRNQRAGAEIAFLDPDVDLCRTR